MYPNLKLEIFRSGVRQNHLAKQLGLGDTVLSKIIHGYRTPSAEQRKVLAEFFKVDENWLFEKYEMTLNPRTAVPETQATQKDSNGTSSLVKESQHLPAAARASVSLKIQLLDDSAAAAWDDFVLQQPRGTFFHLTGWMRVIAKTFGYRPYYFYARRGREISAIAPLFLVDNWIMGKCLISSPFAVYGGICAEDHGSEQHLLEHLMHFAREQETQHLELRQAAGGIYPGFHPNTLYSTFVAELSPNNDVNFKKLPNDTRYMIRKAIKASLTTRRGLEQIDLFYRLLCLNMHHHGTPTFPNRLFVNLMEEFRAQIELMVIYKEQEPVSAVLSFLHKDTVLPHYAGLTPQARKLAANNFMYWELMKYAAESGLRRFDFGRSKKDTGAYFFKTQWNMETRPLDYQVYLVKRKIAPNFSQLNPKFEKATRVWQKLPFWSANLLGPHVVKWFP